MGLGTGIAHGHVNANAGNAWQTIEGGEIVSDSASDEVQLLQNRMDTQQFPPTSGTPSYSLNRAQLPDPAPSRRHTEIVDYLNIIGRGKWIIIGTFLAVAALTVLYTWTRPWIYESHAKMLISTEKSPNATSLFLGMMGQEERNIKNEVEVMRSKPLMLATARLIRSQRTIPGTQTLLPILSFDDLREKYRPQTSNDTIEAVAARLNENLQLLSIRDADVVEVHVRSTSADEAALIINDFVQTYQSDNENVNRTNAHRICDFLSGQVDRTHDTLSKAEGELQTYMSQNRAVEMDEQSKNIIQKMSDFDSKYNESKIMEQTLDRTLKEYKRQLKEVEPEFSDDLAASANPYIESLQNEIARLEVRRDLIITKNESYASKVAYDNAMGQLEQQINDLKGKLRQKTEELRRSKLGSVPVTLPQGSNTNGTVSPTLALNALKQRIFELEIQKQAETAKAEALKNARSLAEADFRNIPSRVIDLARLERTSSSLGKLNDLLSEKLNEATIAEQSVFGNVRVFEPAVANTIPVSPNRMLNLAIGCIIGLLLGVGLVIGHSFMDATIRTPEDLENRGFTVLAAIPKIPRNLSVAESEDLINDDNRAFFANLKPETLVSSHLITHLNSKSPIAENYRSIRTAIQFAAVDKHMQTVMVASSVPQEGKSTTSVNIATTMAQTGNKTLWIDCDLRRPVGHNVFHTTKEPGIVDVLVGSRSVDDAIRQSGIPNLDIMTSGPIPPNPSELLGSRRMKELLEELKGRYTTIIIDTPPVVAVTDAVILSTMVDAYILVARAESTHMEIVMKSRDTLNRVGGRLLGIVLNDFNVSNNYGSYYKYYRYYKYDAYYGDDAPLQGVKKPRIIKRSSKAGGAQSSAGTAHPSDKTAA